MDHRTLQLNKRTVSIFIPDNCDKSTIIYTHFTPSDAEAIATLMVHSTSLVAIDGIDWECDLSPWPAQRAFRGGRDFSGGADSYVQELTKSLIPAVEEMLGYIPDHRGIAGYSMAGLFAIYALYRTDQFDRAASISGSLWYDDFIDFMKQNRPLMCPERIYFSIGGMESITKNKRLSKALDCTIQAEALLKPLGAATLFEKNPGNHFTEVHERVVKGIDWIQ